MPVQINVNMTDMFRRAVLEGVSHDEAVARITAERRASTIFYRSGTPYFDGSRRDTVRKDIDGKPYAVGRSKCIRCGGAGGFKEWPGYTCYRCGGSCYEPNLSKERLYTADEIDRLDAIKAKKDAGRAAKAAAAQAEADAAREERIAALRASEALYVDLEAEAEGDEFLTDILNKWPDRDLTAAQRAAAAASIARKRGRREQAAMSRHIGKEGEKISFEGRVEAVVQLGMDAYGNNRFLVRITTSEGAALVWFTTGARPASGASVTGTATVKKHDAYNGTAQTIITRAKFK